MWVVRNKDKVELMRSASREEAFTLFDIRGGFELGWTVEWEGEDIDFYEDLEDVHD